MIWLTQDLTIGTTLRHPFSEPSLVRRVKILPKNYMQQQSPPSDLPGDKNLSEAGIQLTILEHLIRGILTDADPEDSKSPDFEERVKELAKIQFQKRFQQPR
jgi:hypothetical protein